MDSLGWFIDQQTDGGILLRRQIEQFDPNLTATLEQVFRYPADALDRLGIAHWFDLERFDARLASAARFLRAQAPAEGLRLGVTTFFFQRSDPTEDHLAHQTLVLKETTPFMRSLIGSVPWQARYHHAWTNFTPEVAGRPGRRRIQPLLSYASRRLDPQLIGYRVPDYPAIWGVSPAVATEYFARLVAHDLGHGYLAEIPFERESFHNAVMIRASVSPDADYPEPMHAFDRLALRELQDPFFFLDAPDEIARAKREALSAVQARIAQELEERMFSADALRAARALWRLPEAPHADDRARCEDLLAKIVADIPAAYAGRLP